jgi:methylmalonyl-CoA mutase C-terminal domain/subunit
MQELHRKNLAETLVLAGGIIPREDIPPLEALGIQGFFGPGTSTKTIIEFLRSHLEKRGHENAQG